MTAVHPLRDRAAAADRISIDCIEALAYTFDGVLEPVDGALRPDPSRPGLGLDLRRRDLEAHCVHRGVVEG